MLQRLPIALPQVETGSNSESLLNEIRKSVHCLYQSMEITKKVQKITQLSQYNEIAFSEIASKYKNGYYIYKL